MLFIFIIISFISCVFSQDFIQEPNIIQVGEYTNLICVLNSTNYVNIYKKYYFIWLLKINEINNYKFLINIINYKIHNNINSKKFNSFIIDDKFILQIINITKDYKKDKFMCEYYNIYKNQPYRNKFKKLTDLTFFNPFSLENMKIEYTNSTQININFKKIFPIPKCFVKINNESFFPENNIQNKTLDYLYSQVNLNMEIENINCSHEVKIICTLLNQNFTINSNDNIYIYNNSSNSMYSITAVLIILFLISISGLIIFLYFNEKTPDKKRKILYSLVNKIKT